MRFIFLCTLVCPFMFSLSAQASEEIDLLPFEKRFCSQAGEDGIIEKVFQLVGTTSKYYVEFGAMDGHALSNTKYLREKFGWKGLLLDCGHENPSINLHKEFITAENICHLFAKYNVPQEFDFISIDIDRNDFYVWKALSTQYRPRVVMIEFSRYFNFDDDKVIKYDPHAVWDGTYYFGASMLALFNLGKKLGYSLIYQDSTGSNLVFIRDNVLQSTGVKFKNMNNVKKLYTIPYIPLDPRVVQARFVSSQDVLK